MRITFEVPNDGRDYLEWIEVDDNFICFDTNKDDAADRAWRGAQVRNVNVGKPIEFHLPIMLDGHWAVLGQGEPGFLDGFPVKSIK